MATIYEARTMQDPEPNPGDTPYFEATADGRLLIKRCNSCGEVHFYPRAVCPYCQSADTQWVESGGRGEIYSFSITRKAGPIPYAIAFVTLDEGVAMMTNIVDCDLDTIRIGQRVRVVFKPTEGGYVMPCFAPE